MWDRNRSTLGVSRHPWSKIYIGWFKYRLENKIRTFVWELLQESVVPKSLQVLCQPLKWGAPRSYLAHRSCDKCVKRSGPKNFILFVLVPLFVFKHNGLHLFSRWKSGDKKVGGITTVRERGDYEESCKILTICWLCCVLFICSQSSLQFTYKDWGTLMSVCGQTALWQACNRGLFSLCIHNGGILSFISVSWVCVSVFVQLWLFWILLRKQNCTADQNRGHRAVNPSFQSSALCSVGVNVEVGVFAQVRLFWVSSTRRKNHFTVGMRFSMWLPGNQKPWVGPQKAWACRCMLTHTHMHTHIGV